MNQNFNPMCWYLSMDAKNYANTENVHEHQVQTLFYLLYKYFNPDEPRGVVRLLNLTLMLKIIFC